jgi:hypothetical protein
MSEKKDYQIPPQLSMEQELKLDTLRRKLDKCDDMATLREYCLGAIRMNMMRGNMFNEIMKQGFLKD